MTQLFSAKPQRYRGVPAHERQAKRRERLLEAAVQVYGDVGFQSATVKAVCKAAGLTERYFYESFPNSQALLIAAFEDLSDQVFEDIRDAGKAISKPGRKRVEAVLDAYCGALEESPVDARVFIVEIDRVGGDVDDAMNRELDVLGQILAEAWGNTQELIDPLVLVCVTGGLIRLMKRWISSDFREPKADIVAAAVNLSKLLSSVS